MKKIELLLSEQPIMKPKAPRGKISRDANMKAYNDEVFRLIALHRQITNNDPSESEMDVIRQQAAVNLLPPPPTIPSYDQGFDINDPPKNKGASTAGFDINDPKNKGPGTAGFDINDPKNKGPGTAGFDINDPQNAPASVSSGGFDINAPGIPGPSPMPPPEGWPTVQEPDPGPPPITAHAVDATAERLEDLCAEDAGFEFSKLCNANYCVGQWSYNFKTNAKDPKTSKTRNNVSFAQFKKDYIAVTAGDSGYVGDFSHPTVIIGDKKFNFYQAARDFDDPPINSILQGSFECLDSEQGTAGTTSKDDHLDNAPTAPRVSQTGRSTRRSGVTGSETSTRRRFYTLATEVTGVDDENEAVRIIQRALVDMGLLIHKKNVFGATNIKAPSSSGGQPNQARYEQYLSRYRYVKGSTENKNAKWPQDDEKFAVDGVPGEKTRNAVERLQFFLKSTDTGPSNLGDTGPNGDGVDGIVGPLTWPLFVFNNKRRTIKSLRPLRSSNQTPAGETVLEPRYTQAAERAEKVTNQREGSPKSDEEVAAVAQQRTQEDAELMPHFMFTGIPPFDKKIEITHRKGKLIDMMKGTRSLAIITHDGKISQENDPLLYDAYYIYESLDGWGTDNEEEVKSIITQYFHDLDFYVETAAPGEQNEGSLADKLESLAETGWGLFGRDDKYFFKGHALYYAYNGRLRLEDDLGSGDLIRWLKDDGLEKEAKIVRARLRAEKFVAARLYYAMRKKEQIDAEKMEDILRRAADVQRLEVSGEKGSLRSNRTKSIEKRPNNRQPTPARVDRDDVEFPRTQFIPNRDGPGFRIAGPGEG